MSGKTNYRAVGEAENVQNVNPYTQGMWSQLGNLQGTYNPNNNIANLQGATSGIQDIVSQIISPYSQGLNETASIMSNQAIKNVASQYSNEGALNSGAALSAMTRGAAEPISAATTNIAGMQSQLGGGLLQSLLGQMGSAYQTGLQGQMGYGAPEWWQPQYVGEYQPGALDIIGGIFSGASTGAAAGMSTGSPYGALLGGLIGGAGGGIAAGTGR